MITNIILFCPCDNKGWQRRGEKDSKEKPCLYGNKFLFPIAQYKHWIIIPTVSPHSFSHFKEEFNVTGGRDSRTLKMALVPGITPIVAPMHFRVCSRKGNDQLGNYRKRKPAKSSSYLPNR